MAYVLVPPTVDEAPAWGGPLFGRVKYPRGISLLVKGSAVVEKRFPTIEEQQAVDITYLGGHVYTLDDIEAQVLIDAGYGACLTRADVYTERTEERY